jgi:hypothetical protein
MSATDRLHALRLIDRLEVCPAKVEPRALTATYRLVRAGREECTDLRFSYEEDVFDLSSPAARDEAQNLADLIALQPALNYGLFADELMLSGRLDAPDRRLAAKMAENTAREIYVNKILTENPFLGASARGIPPIVLPRYLRAALRFERPAAENHRGQRAMDDVARAIPLRCAVLSSGGKESLLSFALLRELGVDVHPIFVNESGRHWFTALNAYRRFAREVPATARVWTSADRLFSWILRRLPIVRPDFAKVRADAYPLRLWTVAVFAFAALPLLRKRGLRVLVTGDEFDTTVQLSHLGIPHHGGLYDQSRTFDRAMSGYYAEKGWGIEQLSSRPEAPAATGRGLFSRCRLVSRRCHKISSIPQLPPAPLRTVQAAFPTHGSSAMSFREPPLYERDSGLCGLSAWANSPRRGPL